MNKFQLILILTLAFIFSSCEKVIEFDLANSSQAIVIEANLTDGKEPFIVLLSKTSPYFDVKSDHKVSGAKVSIRTLTSRKRYCVETSPGIYTLEKPLADSNYKYVVEVENEGTTFTASSYLNEKVSIFDLGLAYFDGYGFFDSGYKISCIIKDPPDVENYYRLKFFVNGKLSNNNGEISLYSDKLFDGKTVGLGQRTIVFQETDTLIIELQSIDKAAYTYFNTLESISGNLLEQSASPANPISNFDNGALGYFSAFSFDRKKIIVKDFIKKFVSK